MFFNCDNINAELFHVGKMKWSKGNFNIAARSYDALTFRIKGSGIIESAGKTYIINENDILFMPRNISYTADYDDTEMIAVHLYNSEYSSDIEVFTPNDINVIKGLFLKAAASWDATLPGYRLRSMACIYEILAQCQLQAHNKLSIKNPSSFDIALKFLQENFKNAETNIASACRYANISESYFRRVFKQRMGKAPVKYLIELRVDYAQRLLSTGAYTVEKAAYQSGFNDAKYFSRLIKKMYGCSPSQLSVI